MKRIEILEKVNEIFIEILDNQEICLNERTVSNDLAEWDSLSHIQLVVAIEKTFHIRFTAREIQSWDNVGQMIDTIENKRDDL